MSDNFQRFSAASILVVIEQTFLRNIVRDILRGVGITQIYIAGSGEEGIAQVMAWKPDLIFIQWNMGDMQGPDFARWVRTSPESVNQETSIIMLTSNCSRESVSLARDAGITELIAKPVVPEQLLSRLQSALADKRKFIRSARFVGPDRRRRKSDDFKGRPRRLSDPVPEHNQNEPLNNKIISKIGAVIPLIKDLDVTIRAQVCAIYHHSVSIQELAKHTGDLDVKDAAQSLTRYIEAVGATGRINKVILCKHFESILNLITIHATDTNLRDTVVTRLDQLVGVELQKQRSA